MIRVIISADQMMLWWYKECRQWYLIIVTHQWVEQRTI